MIGVVTTSYPRFPGDFAGAFVATRVRRHQAAGARVHVIAAGPASAGGGSHVDRGETHGDPAAQTRVASRLFYSMGAPEVIDSGGAGFAAAHFTLRLVDAIRAHRGRLHAIESHWLVPSGLAVALGAPGLFHRAFVHSGDLALLERLPAGLGASLARFIVARTQAVVCVSHDLRIRLERLLGARRPQGRLSVQRLAVDPDADFSRDLTPGAAGSRSSRGPGEPRERLVLGIGRLVPIKGFDVLVHAVGRIPGHRRPRVRILGEGPEGPRLARAARACGVRLDLPGAVAHAEVADALAYADVCVVPSRNLPGGRTEGLPMAALEALAAGTPLVASAVGGLVELGAMAPSWSAAGTPPVLVPAEDPAALSRALDAALHGDSRPGRHSDIPCATDGRIWTGAG